VQEKTSLQLLFSAGSNEAALSSKIFLCEYKSAIANNYDSKFHRKNKLLFPEGDSPNWLQTRLENFSLTQIDWKHPQNFHLMHFHLQIGSV
jgi:hypothetical protein